MVPVPVSRSRREDLERIAAIIVAAFRADPFVRWMLPDEVAYKMAFGEVALRHAETAIAHDSAHHTDDYTGAALWLPPGIEPAPSEHFYESIPEVRHSVVDQVFQMMHEVVPAETHWHLRLLGVEPAAQGQGLGSTLLTQSLAVCDAEHEAAYLEATSPGSKALYERHGFEATGVIQAADSPFLWPMVRPAR